MDRTKLFERLLRSIHNRVMARLERELEPFSQALEIFVTQLTDNLPADWRTRWHAFVRCANGADVISYNTKTKQITLWDDKYRGKPTVIADSKTFTNPVTLEKALKEAKTQLWRRPLSPLHKAAAIDSIRNKTFLSITHPSGKARLKAPQ